MPDGWRCYQLYLDVSARNIDYSIYCDSLKYIQHNAIVSLVGILRCDPRLPPRVMLVRASLDGPEDWSPVSLLREHIIGRRLLRPGVQKILRLLWCCILSRTVER